MHLAVSISFQLSTPARHQSAHPLHNPQRLRLSLSAIAHRSATHPAASAERFFETSIAQACVLHLPSLAGVEIHKIAGRFGKVVAGITPRRAPGHGSVVRGRRKWPYEGHLSQGRTRSRRSPHGRRTVISGPASRTCRLPLGNRRHLRALPGPAGPGSGERLAACIPRMLLVRRGIRAAQKTQTVVCWLNALSPHRHRVTET